MPQKNGTIVCINHPETQMKSDAGALNMIPGNLRHDVIRVEISTGFPSPTASGAEVPVEVFTCEVCGYVELYVRR